MKLQNSFSSSGTLPVFFKLRQSKDRQREKKFSEFFIMDHRQCMVFPGLVIFLWTADILSANQNIENGRTDKSKLDSTYFFYERPDYPRDCQEVKDHCTSTNTSGLHLIRPDGYPEPFEVFCDNSQDSDGWTVIQRRDDGRVYFERNWTEYKLGFGFLSTEFWLGNYKLSYLTNQKKYEIRIDMTNSYGMSFYVIYNMFRISDDSSDYNLASLGEYSGNAGTFITWCQVTTGYDNCTCQKTCENPHDCLDTCDDEGICICPEDYYLKEGLCVPKEECGCYVFEGIVIPEGDIYASSDCTRLAACRNGQLRWDENYECGTNEECDVRNNTRQCYCTPGSVGKGADCVTATDCFDLYKAGFRENGVYKIKPKSYMEEPFEVYCRNMSDGGAWTVFQHREDGSVDFFQNWTTYREGFGSANHEMWLGNEKLYHLTKQKRYILRIDLVNREGLPYYAKFDDFQIGNEDSKYQLIVLGAYTGTADKQATPNGYALTRHLNQPFSTHDEDNDPDSRNCAEVYHGAWWYKTCHSSNLNGDYHGAWDNGKSIYWYYLPGSYYNILYTEMKLRPFNDDM